MSNLKQIGLATMMYAQDYDERLPSSSANNGGDAIPGTGYGRPFQKYIEPYVKNVQVFKCPSDTSNLTSVWGYVYSYGYNYIGLALTGLKGAVSTSAIQSPSETVMLTDKSAGATNPQQDYVYSPQCWISNGGACQAASSPAGTNPRLHGDVDDRHLDTVSVLWADGHVKSMKVSALAGPAGCVNTACDALWDLK